MWASLFSILFISYVYHFITIQYMFQFISSQLFNLDQFVYAWRTNVLYVIPFETWNMQFTSEQLTWIKIECLFSVHFIYFFQECDVARLFLCWIWHIFIFNKSNMNDTANLARNHYNKINILSKHSEYKLIENKRINSLFNRIYWY